LVYITQLEESLHFVSTVYLSVFLMLVKTNTDYCPEKQ